MAVLDASVYVALVNSREPAYARCWTWLEATLATGEPISAPSILLAEVAAALSRGLGDAALARQVVEHLIKSSVVDLVPVSIALAGRAAAIAAEQRLRGCDAVYVALAQELRDSLVTLDREQMERGTAVVPVREP